MTADEDDELTGHPKILKDESNCSLVLVWNRKLSKRVLPLS